jgi:hypothetical protein
MHRMHLIILVSSNTFTAEAEPCSAISMYDYVVSAAAVYVIRMINKELDGWFQGQHSNSACILKVDYDAVSVAYLPVQACHDGYHSSCL